jgi:two-component system KDP operon response regulator KdpE
MHMQTDHNGDRPPQILVVDDDLMVCSFLKDVFTRQGYLTRFAPTGREALSSIERQPPDVLVLDLTMPGMNGVEMLRRLKAANPHGLPYGVIIVTGSMENPLFDEALDLGILDVLLKPMSLMQIQAAVRLQLKLLADQRAS